MKCSRGINARRSGRPASVTLPGRGSGYRLVPAYDPPAHDLPSWNGAHLEPSALHAQQVQQGVDAAFVDRLFARPLRSGASSPAEGGGAHSSERPRPRGARQMAGTALLIAGGLRGGVRAADDRRGRHRSWTQPPGPHRPRAAGHAGGHLRRRPRAESPGIPRSARTARPHAELPLRHRRCATRDHAAVLERAVRSAPRPRFVGTPHRHGVLWWT
jgi:hypothetical protein